MYVSSLKYGADLDLITNAPSGLNQSDLVTTIITQNKEAITNVYGAEVLANLDFLQHIFNTTQYFNVNCPVVTTSSTNNVSTDANAELVNPIWIFVNWYTTSTVAAGYSHECIINISGPIVEVNPDLIKQRLRQVYPKAVAIDEEIFIVKYLTY